MNISVCSPQLAGDWFVVLSAAERMESMLNVRNDSPVASFDSAQASSESDEKEDYPSANTSAATKRSGLLLMWIAVECINIQQL